MKILVVDDDPQSLDNVTIGLRFQWQDSRVIVAEDGRQALARFSAHAPEMVLLDTGLPDISGYDVLREIRLSSDVPVILLSEERQEVAQVRGLELGADDYIIKPFGHLMLFARIRAVLRRCELPAPEPSLPNFVAGTLTINFSARRVMVGGQQVNLTPIEYRLLVQLARYSGRVLPHEMLLNRIWGTDFPATTANLKVLVSRLRQKLQFHGDDYIRTERGIGYRLVRPEAASLPQPELAIQEGWSA